MYANRLFKFSTDALASHSIAGIHIPQKILAIDMLKALKASLEHDHKHIVRLLRQYGDGNYTIKMRIKTSTAFPLCLFAYPYHLFICCSF